jgi:hypothetical protein
LALLLHNFDKTLWPKCHIQWLYLAAHGCKTYLNLNLNLHSFISFNRPVGCWALAVGLQLVWLACGPSATGAVRHAVILFPLRAAGRPPSSLLAAMPDWQMHPVHPVLSCDVSGTV